MELNQDSLDRIATINNQIIVSRELEGEAVILNLESGVYFGLNEVGRESGPLFSNTVHCAKFSRRCGRNTRSLPRRWKAICFSWSSS